VVLIEPFCGTTLQPNLHQIAKKMATRHIEAVEGAFGSDIYGPSLESEKRYSPAKCIGPDKHRIEGNPDPKYVSTSFAERSSCAGK
jgi:hypothetical protein